MKKNKTDVINIIRWGIYWESSNAKCLTDVLKNFRTRSECKKYIKENYGYIAKRKDLRSKPFCWRIPKAVKILISIKKY